MEEKHIYNAICLFIVSGDLILRYNISFTLPRFQSNFKGSISNAINNSALSLFVQQVTVVQLLPSPY